MPRLPLVFSRLLVILLVGVLLRHWALIPGFFRNLADPINPILSASSLTYSVVVGGFLGLLVGAIVGLLRRRIWGVYCAYALVPVSTILHSIPLIPFISDLLPTLEVRIAAVAILNLAFLAIAALLHLSYHRVASAGGSTRPEGTL